MSELKFSVLMSLYINEKTKYVRQCFESLERQTLQANEWVVVEDGPLRLDMYELLDEYQEKYPEMIRRVILKENKGLGLALRAGVEACSFQLIARMDTDDIAREDRFERQIKMFKNDSFLDICGSYVKEFEGELDNIVSRRIVPLSNKDIQKYQKRRDAFNHMTVMYKKEAVLKAGNYQSCLLMEDTLLWVNMIMSGAKCANIDDYLVYVRTGNDLIARRGGYDYFLKYKNGRKKVKETGFINNREYYLTISVQFIVAIIPLKLRKFVYNNLLHSLR